MQGLDEIELVYPAEQDDEGGIAPIIPSFAKHIWFICILRQVLYVLDDAPFEVPRYLHSL